MQLVAMIGALRIELQDVAEAVHSDTELSRAVQKTVSLMSRHLPKRSIVETTLARVITEETLTISSDTGTLAYKPIKVGSLAITGKTLDTHYQVNYLTGVVTEVGSGLPDTDYTATYELDSHIFDLSSILTDYVKIEWVEYPLEDGISSRPTYDLVGGFLLFRREVELTDDYHLRVVYHSKWTMPGVSDGDYPSHLDDIVIIGSAGQALIFKAEAYMQLARSTASGVLTVLATLDNLVAPTTPLAPNMDDVTPPGDYSVDALAAPDLPAAPTAPTTPDISDITPPSDYTFVKPSCGDFPAAPSAPSALDLGALTPPTDYTLNKPFFGSAPTPPTTLSFTLTGYEAAADAIEALIADAKLFLSVGSGYINQATRGDNVAANYGQYANVAMEAAAQRNNEAVHRLRLLEEYVGTYRGDVDKYASEVTAYLGKYQGEVQTETAGINEFLARVNKYRVEVDDYNQRINEYREEVNSYLAEVNSYSAQVTGLSNKFQTEVQAENAGANALGANVTNYRAQIEEESMKLTKYAQEVQGYRSEVEEYAALMSGTMAKYQGQIQAEVVSVNNFAAQVTKYQAEIAEENLKNIKYDAQVRSYLGEVTQYQAAIGAIIARATQESAQVPNYISVAGRYLASGQSKINEFLAALGVKIELPVQRASAEQRA